jgi:hypothetical protein
MNRELVDNVVNAVLYEGYILYPYRAVSKKISANVSPLAVFAIVAPCS